MTRRRQSTIERLSKKLDVQPDGCWLWTGYVTERGYGQIGVWDGPSMAGRRVHRVMYEELVEPIPEGLQLDHTCHNADPDCSGGTRCIHRRCANPDHLEVVTGLENVRRALGGDEATCRRGHERTPENTFKHSRGGPACRECRRIAERRRRIERAAA